MAQTTDYALLGILTHGPQSGYDIKKHISRSIGYFWQESYGQLYPALKRMVNQDLLSMYIEKNEKKPEKKIYKITLKGREKLKVWLQQPVQSFPRIRHELLLKLFFGTETSIAVNRRHVTEYKEKCEHYREELQQIKKMIEQMHSANPASTYWLITVSSGLHSFGAEIDWCNETLNILSIGVK